MTGLGELLLAAAGTGVLGSLHCAAMCGPLAAAGCTRGGRTDPAALGLYLLGRLVAYSAMGAVMGSLGEHALCLLPMAAVQAVAAAAVALYAGARGLRLLWPPRRPGTARGRTLVQLAAAVLPRRGLALGMATAILPCGMLVPAWLLAAGTALAPAGAAVMAVFGLATAPGLLLPVLGGTALGRAGLARLSPRAYGLAWCALAVWLALRPFVHHGHVH